MASEKFEKGMKIRREVMGDEYVDRSLRNADEFMRPMVELTTEYCWGEVWGRDDVSRPTRSLINIAMLAAMNRQQELKAHARGALRNGCTREQLQSVLLQVAVYAGIPAAVEGFRSVKEVLAETQS